MTLEISYKSEQQNLVSELSEIILQEFPEIIFESYNEDTLKEGAKARRLKHAWGTKLSPFALLKDDENHPISAFYSEVYGCNIMNILTTLKKYNNHDCKN